MIRFEHPEIFLLGLVVLLVFGKRLHAGRAVTTLRVVLLGLLLGLLAGPLRLDHAAGRDLILVVDRSRSVPPESSDALAEYAALAKEHLQPGDRIGVISFGREAVVEQSPTEDFTFRTPEGVVDPDGTDIAAALEAALGVIAPGRQGSVLLLSDGEATGRGASAAARQSLRRGIRIDAVPLRRPGAFDLAVEDIALPGEVATGEPFQVSVWVRADRPVEAPFTLLRDGKPIASGTRAFRRGLNRLRFQDAIRAPGVHRYEVRCDVGEDRILENNRARGAVRVTGPFRVLAITPQGREDRLTRSLRAAGLAVTVHAPAGAPLSLDALDGVRAVILEDIPLEDLPRDAPVALRAYVRDLGGGLLMTGGRASFGPGGYYRSPIEEVLPVSMEIREEERKFSLAMAIALDRSGSMSMRIPTGETKMDLANLGAIAAVEMLGRRDSVAVIAVDSAAHIVVPLTRAADKPPILDAIRSIESMGGGIFTYTALRAAANELRSASQGTKHIVVFADARDAEEPGDYKTFVPQLRKAGVTVSVIGLGSDTDVDADFLKDLAKLGGGRCFFGDDPMDLPRMFAQETIQVARSSIVEEPTGIAVVPDIVAVGALQGGAFPTVGGYSIAYLKPGAQRGLVTKDDTGAPLLAFQQAGLGRSAAYLGIADGPLAGGVATWGGYSDFFATLVRWLAGTEAVRDVYAEVTRRGHEAIVSVEVESHREDLLGGIEARMLGPDGTPQALLLTRVGDTRLEARMPLPREGIYRPVLKLADGRFLRLPALTLPYSPEFEPRLDPAEGERTLRDLVRIAGGRLDPPAEALLAGSRASTGVTPLGAWFAWAALAVLLLEILVRRLRPQVPLAPLQRVASALRRGARRPFARRRSHRRAAARTETETPADTPPEIETEPKPAPDAEPQQDLTSLLERAKRRRPPQRPS